MELNSLPTIYPRPFNNARELSPIQPSSPPAAEPVDRFLPAGESLAPRPFQRADFPTGEPFLVPPNFSFYPNPGQNRDPRSQQSSDFPPGSLIILDNGFSQGVMGEDHGAAVTRAARVAGFNGQIRQVPVEQSFNLAPVGIPAQNPDRARQAFRDFARNAVVNMLDSTGRRLDGFSQNGVRNSALNISSGLSQADLVRNLELMIESNPAIAANAALAFGVDLGKLGSSDPQVALAERQRLLQGLVDNTHQAVTNNPDIGAARQRYDEAVRRFEGNNNSVVVATSNPRLSDGVPGVRYPEDYHRSFNINDQVTAVSSRPADGAPASPLDTPQAIYTDGRVMHRHAPRLPFRSDETDFVPGTSFAAPRVTALTAELHRQNPGLTSSQVENLLRNRFTQQQEGRTELNDLGAYQYMRAQTY